MVDIETVRDETAPIYPELKNPSAPDDREAIIQWCYELLCSGRPLSEILDEVKRLSHLSEGGKLDISTEPGSTQVSDRPDEARSNSSTRSESKTAHSPEPTPLSVVYRSRQFSSPLAAYSFVWRLRSLRAKTIVLTVACMLASAFTYVEFSKTHQDSQHLPPQSVRDEGRVISQSLLPMLENAAIDDLPQLGRQLERFAGRVTTIKLLLAPAGSDGEKFYYAGSWPRSDLEAARQTLARQGVLDRLTESCRSGAPFSLIYDRTIGGAEIIAVTPLSTAVGCWAVVTTFSADASPPVNLGQRKDARGVGPAAAATR
jgi:hypothetical protein